MTMKKINLLDKGSVFMKGEASDTRAHNPAIQQNRKHRKVKMEIRKNPKSVAKSG